MNFAVLDQQALEALVLDPPSVESEPLRCTDAFVAELIPSASDPRSTQLRHVLVAAHELLVRIASRAMVGRTLLDKPALVKDYLKVLFAGAEHETFVVIFLDAQIRVIATEEMFRGTLTQTSVYPREVVKRAMQHNAACLIVSHCHPSGSCEPSRADEFLTQTLKSAVAIVDVRLMDHIVVGGSSCCSFAERGLL